MKGRIEVKTADLIGKALDWAVAQVEVVNYRKDGIKCKTRLTARTWHHYTKPNFSPSTDWSHGGPLIDKYRPDIEPRRGAIAAYLNNRLSDDGPLYSGFGETYLVAACRVIVLFKLGETVSVPKELVQ